MNPARVLRDGHFVMDGWRHLRVGEAAPPSGQVIFPLDWWLDERAAFDGSNVPLGVRIDAGADLATILPDLPRLSLIALVFPKFSDGRAYSMAKMLRERHGFSGDLRATGDVLIDQMQLMQRCGCSSFEVQDAATAAALEAGDEKGMRLFYQPSSTSGESVGPRPWLRLRN